MKARCYNFPGRLGMLGGPRDTSFLSMATGKLIPDAPLQFSAELASVIGLEEAVFIQQLKTVHRHQPSTQRDGLAWLHLSHAYLQELLPFWDLPTLLRVCDSLVDIGLLHIDRERAARDCVLLAIDEGHDGSIGAPIRPPTDLDGGTRAAAAPSSVPSRARRVTGRAKTASEHKDKANTPARALPSSGRGEPLPPDFVPSEDMLELLERFHGVPRGFALAQLEDFTLYWRERGSAGHAWQNRFKQHVQWHWKRRQQEGAGIGDTGEQGSGSARRTRDSSLEHDLTDTTWAD